MKSQKLSFSVGNLRFTLAVGDENENGIVDVSLAVRVVGFFELPKVIVDLSAENAQKVVDGFNALRDAVLKKK